MAYCARDQDLGTNDIYILDLARNAERRLTSDRRTENTPIWTRDGLSLVYAADRTGPPSLFMRAANGAGEERPIVPPEIGGPQRAYAITPDGKFVLYSHNEPRTGLDILIAPLDGTASELREDAHKQTEPLEKEITFMTQGEYEIALRDLWRMHETDKGNRDVTRLMVDSYYNLGVKDLQREAPGDAVQKFKEGLGLDPNDPGLVRLARFSSGYQNRPQDLQYRIFVKYLATR